MREGKTIPIPKQNARVGKRHPKYDADKLTLGNAPYVDDLKFEGMLYGALKFSKYPRAKVVGIDISSAEKLKGIRKIILAKDIPGERITGSIVKDWPMMVEVGETTRYVGDVLASVVAESDDIARKALELITINYEVLNPLTEMSKALDKDAPQIHKNGNLLSETIVDRGNLDTAKNSQNIFQLELMKLR